MASYVSPVDLIQPYLQPLVGSVNTGIEQGLKFGTLQQAINKEKMLEPYYKAHSDLYNAQAAEKAVQAKRVADAMAAFPGAAKEGGYTPADFINAHVLGINLKDTLPHNQFLEKTGTLLSTAPGGPTTTTRLLPPQKEIKRVLSGDTEQDVLVDPYGGTGTLMIPRAGPAVMPETVAAPQFNMGEGFPMRSEPEITTGTAPAIPGPRFKPPVEKRLTIGQRVTRQEGDRSVTDEIIGFKENGAPIWEEVSRGPKFAPKVEKPEYTPKQALSRISTIDATIARMKSSGTVDIPMAIQNPAFAMLVDTKDPEAVKHAIASLESEREYVSQFAPKPIPQPKKETPKMKTLDQKTAVEILKEARGDKNKAREIARKRGYAF